MKGSSKYGPTGNCTDQLFGDLNLPAATRDNLAKWGNYGLAQGTWSSYKTAERILLICLKKKGVKLELPISQEVVAMFIEWLLEERKVSAGMVNNYLSGLRQMHVTRGIEPPLIRTVGVNWVLRGKKKCRKYRKKEKWSERQTSHDTQHDETVEGNY